MTLRADDELDQVLTEVAKAEGVSKQEVVRRAVLARRESLGHEACVSDASADLEEIAVALG